ncbi:MAG: hypothetical protein A3F67_08105 [Verrucomicrobia bacterium RIFCSPHIGHO2_12_FULL_41_10]|nr:MAG: hypothetical protein A3F67_08105 [Verrucomicrobia bacterium RIFCSPHIGHO2_12_FULL_41_10]
MNTLYALEESVYNSGSDAYDCTVIAVYADERKAQERAEKLNASAVDELGNEYWVYPVTFVE